MVATVVASTTVEVAPASLGDFAVAAAAVNLEDVAGSRRRRAVVARGGDDGAVGACVGVLAGSHWGQLGRGKALVAPLNSAGVGRNFMEIHRTRNRRRSSFGCRPV